MALESVEDMVEYLNQTPQLFFTLALIELQVYKFPNENESFLVIPQVVTRTKEIIRAVFRVEGAHSQDLKITIDPLQTELIDKQGKSSKGRFTISADDFFGQLQQNTNKLVVDSLRKLIAECEEKDITSIGDKEVLL